MGKYRKQLRWATIVVLLIFPIYQQIYWWTHGCVSAHNCVISVVWLALCCAIAYMAGSILFPDKNN